MYTKAQLRLLYERRAAEYEAQAAEWERKANGVTGNDCHAQHLRGVCRGRARQCRQAARAARVAWHSYPAGIDQV